MLTGTWLLLTSSVQCFLDFSFIQKGTWNRFIVCVISDDLVLTYIAFQTGNIWMNNNKSIKVKNNWERYLQSLHPSSMFLYVHNSQLCQMFVVLVSLQVFILVCCNVCRWRIRPYKCVHVKHIQVFSLLILKWILCTLSASYCSLLVLLKSVLCLASVAMVI